MDMAAKRRGRVDEKDRHKKRGKRGSGRNQGVEEGGTGSEVEARRSGDDGTAPQCAPNHNIKMIPENNMILLRELLNTLLSLLTGHCQSF